MTQSKSEQAFSTQLLNQLDTVFERDVAREFINRAKSQNSSGAVSRVFNDLGLDLPPYELQKLLDAREAGGWPAFAKAISEQIEPIIDSLFYSEKPTPFDTFYSTHFRGTSFSQEEIKSKLVSGLVTQYAECATDAMFTTYPNDASFMSDTISAINEVATLIQTPEAIKASAQSSLINPGPIKAHLTKLQTIDQKKVSMLATNDIAILLGDTINERKKLQALDSKNSQVLQLIDILLELEKKIAAYSIDPDEEPVEKTIPLLLTQLLDIQAQLDALESEKKIPEFGQARQNISNGLKTLQSSLEKNLQRLDKVALQIIDLKLGMNISEVVQTLDTQLAALETLAQKNTVFSGKNSPLAKNTQTAIDTIKEIKRTLLKDATELSVGHSIEAIPILTQKIVALNQVLQQTANDLTAHTRGPIRQAIHNIFEPIFRAVSNFTAWCTGYISKDAAKKTVQSNIQTQLKENESLTKNLSQISLTSQTSPAILTEPPNNKSSNLAADFQRALDCDELFVNGKALSEYADDFNDFEEESDVMRFIHEVILKDVTGDKTPMLRYMKEKFHQGGLFWPVTSAVQEAMTKHPDTGQKSYHAARLRDTASTHKVNITSNDTGFLIEETLVANNILVAPNPYSGEENPLYLASEDKTTLSAEKEGMPILSAKGTVQVDFSDGACEPTLTAVENSITYGHRVLAETMEMLRENRVHMLEQIAETGLTDTELSSRGSTPEPNSDSEEETRDGPPF